MLILLLFVICVLIYCFGVNRILGLPPGPPPLPFVGNMLSMQGDMDKASDSWMRPFGMRARKQMLCNRRNMVFLDWKVRYGRIFTVWLPYPMVVIGDHQVLQDHVVKDGSNFFERKIPEQFLKLWFGGFYGLGFQENSTVKETRKFALKTFHEIGFNSAAVEDTVYNYAVEVVSRWRASGGAPVNVEENIEKAITNIVWRFTFGHEHKFDNDFLPSYRKIQLGFISLASSPLMLMVEMFPSIAKADRLLGNHFKRLKALLDESNKIVADAIERTESSFNPDNEPTSFVEAFLRETKKIEGSGKPKGIYHYRQMHASAVNLLLAGFDSSIGMIRMCILELVNNPDAQRRVQQEIADRIGSRRIRYEDQKLLPYTCAFLQEIYRLGNVLPLNFQRSTSRDTEICGHHIAKGTTILPQYSMVHLDSNEFERPELFCPDRHIDDDGKFVKDPRINQFSLGKRACIGENLARVEIFVMFATMVQGCHFKPANKVPPPVTFFNGATRSVNEFMVKIEPSN